MVSWILERIRIPEKPVTQNKQYAAEVLAILVQSSSSNRKRVVDHDGVDLLLQLLSVYRKRDPEKGTDEEEYVENVFDSLTCLVEEVEGKTKFVEAEGVELCLIMLKEGIMSRPRALRLLDHSVAGPQSGEVAEKIVDAAGLKPIFSMFMKKVYNFQLGSPQLVLTHRTARKSDGGTSSRDHVGSPTSSTSQLRASNQNDGQVCGKGLREDREAHQATAGVRFQSSACRCGDQAGAGPSRPRGSNRQSRRMVLAAARRRSLLLAGMNREHS